MPWNVNNRLLPVIAILVLLALFFVLMRSCGSDEQPVPRMDSVPTASQPDADSPADTIKTLTANVGELIAEVDALRKDNADLHNERSELEARFSNQIASELSDYNQSQTTIKNRSENEILDLKNEVESLNDQLQRLSQQLSSGEYPLGYGHDQQSSVLGGASSTTYMWIQPLDDAVSTSDSGSFSESSLVHPVSTIPRNATLIGSTAMTALIGRVPIDGQVRDPMPFKVLTGNQNLAANGLKIDGIHGMVWSGFAVGDWTLGCISGRLNSVTFVFEDGRIQTVSTSEGGGYSSESSLGWISNERGMPCIPGSRQSNANVFLAQQATLTAAQAAAEASAALETTQTIDLLGGTHSLVSGDVAKYVLSGTVAGATQASADWLAKRASQEFDAIYVAAGERVAIHVDQEIFIDYNQGGRKLQHDQIFQGSSVSDLD